MVAIVSVGVLSIQGAVSEHIHAFSQIFTEKSTKGLVKRINTVNEFNQVDALVIPGGESTTISRVLCSSGLYKRICDRLEDDDISLMGTCAGCVLLAKKLTNPSDEIQLLGAIDMEVERNAFGRQRESFEEMIAIEGFSTPFPGIFIRSPVVTQVWGDCEVLCSLHGSIVAVRQNRFLGVSFHPELTDDLRIHRFFLDHIV